MLFHLVLSSLGRYNKEDADQEAGSVKSKWRAVFIVSPFFPPLPRTHLDFYGRLVFPVRRGVLRPAKLAHF
jgi:hypothetical protein